MPLPMVHLSTAVKINTLQDLKSPEFYLGSISPDAVHMRTGFVRDDKARSQTYGERYIADLTPIQDKRMAYYNDTDQLDFAFYEKENWRPEIWEMLTQAEDFAIEGAVNKDEVIAWKHRTLNWYNSGKSQHTNPIKYITYEDLDGFTSYAAEKCEKYLQSKGLGVRR